MVHRARRDARSAASRRTATIDEFNAGLSGSDDAQRHRRADPTANCGSRSRAPGGDKIERFSPANPDDPCFWSTGLTGAPNQIVTASDSKLYFTESDNPARSAASRPTARSRSTAPA